MQVKLEFSLKTQYQNLKLYLIQVYHRCDYQVQNVKDVIKIKQELCVNNQHVFHHWNKHQQHFILGALTGVKCLDESQFILVDEVAGIVGATYEGEQQDYNNNLIILLQNGQLGFITLNYQSFLIQFQRCLYLIINLIYINIKCIILKTLIVNLLLHLEVMMRVYLIKKQDILYLDDEWIIYSQIIDMNGILGIDKLCNN